MVESSEASKKKHSQTRVNYCNEEKKQRGIRVVVDSGRGGLVHPS